MITGQVIKGVEELLRERGVHMQGDERLGDTVARELGITPAQAERLLETLHDGGTVEEAIIAAGVPLLNAPHSELMNDIARKIGTALGRLTR